MDSWESSPSWIGNRAEDASINGLPECSRRCKAQQANGQYGEKAVRKEMLLVFATDRGLCNKRRRYPGMLTTTNCRDRPHLAPQLAPPDSIKQPENAAFAKVRMLTLKYYSDQLANKVASIRYIVKSEVSWGGVWRIIRKHEEPIPDARNQTLSPVVGRLSFWSIGNCAAQSADCTRSRCGDPEKHWDSVELRHG